MLKMRKVDVELTEKAIVILDKLANNRDALIEELKDVICDILEPLVTLDPTPGELREREVKVNNTTKTNTLLNTLCVFKGGCNKSRLKRITRTAL